MTAMSEDELLEGITDALTVGGWLWHHLRRSDLALQQGRSGWPDIVALHPERGEVFVAELKAQRGRLEPAQQEWLDAFSACGIPGVVIRPGDYDRTWRFLVGDRLVTRRGHGCVSGRRNAREGEAGALVDALRRDGVL